MGLVTFKDADGVKWRVWRVSVPSARAHLLDASFREGWLVFERTDEMERRRLSNAPDDWASLSQEQLGALLAAATPVTSPRSFTTEQLIALRPQGGDR